MKLILSLLGIFLATILQAQHTFSIIAVDPVTGMVGSAGASCIDGSIIISDMIPGRGGVHAQASVCIPNSNLQYAILQMNNGLNPSDILDSLIANDQCGFGSYKNRQYGIVDFDQKGNPRSESYTGVNALNWKGHLTGPNYSIQGNILIGEEVLDSMEARFLRFKGTFPEKMMYSLQGANMPGADARCLSDSISSLSAFIRIALPDDTPGNFFLDINVNESPTFFEPIDSVQTLFDIWNNDCAAVTSNFSQDKDSVNIVTGDSVRFTTSLGPSNITTWGWDLGDGKQIWGPEILHVYQLPGTYTIKHIVTDRSCTDTSYSEVIAYEDCDPVNANFTQSKTNINLGTESGVVSFLADSSTTFAKSWLWDFGDQSGFISTVPNPEHTYTTSGTFTVTLTVTNGSCSDTKTSTVEAYWPTNISDKFNPDDEFSCYPNPISDKIWIDLPDEWVRNHRSLQIELLNTKGQIVLHKHIKQDNLSIVTLEDIKPGLYILKISNQNTIQLITKKVIVQ